ncbi:MAG TPA: hypothetical protein VN039_07440 [Nitrospira sp.]|nr:hypothetical protein [Nitrospira sp.]
MADERYVHRTSRESVMARQVTHHAEIVRNYWGEEESAEIGDYVIYHPFHERVDEETFHEEYIPAQNYPATQSGR